jgi:hypothetical protein
MTTISTQATSSNKPTKQPLTLAGLVAAFFMVDLREKLDAQTAGDKTDAAYTWGM